jgi:acetoin utilization protein AcuA
LPGQLVTEKWKLASFSEWLEGSIGYSNTEATLPKREHLQKGVTSMSTEDDKAATRRGFEERWNQGNIDVFDELFASTFIYHDPDPEASGSARTSRVKTYKTAAGPVFLRSCCSPSFVEGLKADEGLRAFARSPERAHQLLLSIAQQPENRLTLAYTASGTVVGRVSLTPLDQWWQGIGNAYEIAVEVSSSWRQLGIAHHLLTFALAFESVEEYLIVGLGLCWHWDEEGLDMSRFHYRRMLARLFAAHGFAEYQTSEPNIGMDPANILLARLGSRIDSESMNRFFQRLLQSETLLGL